MALASEDFASSWHTVSFAIPFLSAHHATIAKRAISVDRELNQHLVERKIVIEGEVLNVTYRAASVRLLRLATNGFMDNISLIVRTIHEFAPAPSEAHVGGQVIDGAAGKMVEGTENAIAV